MAYIYICHMIPENKNDIAFKIILFFPQLYVIQIIYNYITKHIQLVSGLIEH